MKTLHGAATGPVAASAEQCLALLADVERYPSWYPDVVRRVDVLESGADGHAELVEVLLRVAHGPLAREFDLTMAVEVCPPVAVRLSRIPHGPSDREEFAVIWRIEEDRGEVRLQVELEASLAVPRLLPLGGIGNAVAEGFLAAAADSLAAGSRTAG